MVTLSKIYTKTGDGGMTHIGDSSLVAKDDLRIESNGDVDELNSVIGSEDNSIGSGILFIFSSFMLELSIFDIETTSVGADEIVLSKSGSFKLKDTFFHCLLASDKISILTIAILSL